MLTPLFRTALQRILRQTETPPAAVIAALSGGMDSVVATRLLAHNADLLPKGCTLIAAHVNHALRPEADADEAFCRDYAESLNIPFAAKRIDVAALAQAERLGLEEAGRLARYHFFRELAGKKGGAALVVTGHHADDQAETILMNLRRGAHRRGLAGMRALAAVPVPPDGKVVVARPLLAAGRAELQKYALAHALPWRTDATNADNAFTRNRIRNKILPILEALLPGFKHRLLARAGRMAEEEETLSRAAAAFAEARTRREGGGLFLRIDGLFDGEADPELLAYALRRIVEQESGKRLPDAALLTRLSALAETARPGETLSLPGRLRARREPDGLFFFPAEAEAAPPQTAELILPAPPFRVVTPHGLEITADWAEITESAGRPPAPDMADPCVEWLNPDAVRWPLRLRPPREGERLRPLGAPGSRKMQDILVDAKLPRRRRSLPRVLADAEGAVWLWPFRLAERMRLPAAPGRALRVTIRERRESGPD